MSNSSIDSDFGYCNISLLDEEGEGRIVGFFAALGIVAWQFGQSEFWLLGAIVGCVAGFMAVAMTAAYKLEGGAALACVRGILLGGVLGSMVAAALIYFAGM